MIADLGRSIGSTLEGLFRRPVTDAVVEETIKNICLQLIRSNVNPQYVSKLREDVKTKISLKSMQSNANKARMVQQAVVGGLTDMLNPVTAPYVVKHGRSNVVVFVGLQGCGKTTSICKYANFYKKKGFRVGIVCADTFRAGAYDQVKQNAIKIGVPFYGSGEPDPIKVAKEGVAKFRKADFELILVDTSGRHVQEEALFEEMRGLVGAVRPDNIVFVMDSGIGQSAEDQANGFKNAVAVGGIILTKMDGAEKAGGAISSVAATGCPIEFVGTGERMDDLEMFNAKRFVSKILGMGDIEGLMEAVSSIDIDQKEMA
ncbi:signal recognition particle subunit SRP54, partial [Pancytospora epiphaga]